MMIFISLVLFSGCFSPKALTGSDIKKNLKSDYEVHAIDTTLWIYDTMIKNDTLFGITGNYKDQRKLYYTKVYLRSELSGYINSGRTLISIPLSEIVVADNEKMPNGLATLIGIGLGMAGMYFLYSIYLIIAI